jgi:hypothetical protein
MSGKPLTRTPATARTQKQQGDQQQPTTAETTGTTDKQATERSHQQHGVCNCKWATEKTGLLSTSLIDFKLLKNI